MSWLKSLLGQGEPKVVTLQPSGRTFVVGKQETILERALKEGVDFPHDCTVGTCGSCRSKLVTGSVEAITPFGYTLSKEELEHGYILACQALPRGPVTLEVELPEGDIPVARRTPAKIVAIEPLTHDIRRVTWEADDAIDYVAGQYINITWPGAPGHRSYSLCEAPAQGGRRRLGAFVRRVPGGSFSELLFAGAPEHVPFEIDGPHGTFWLRRGTGPILCIAGGSGLSPLMSLLEDAAAKGVKRDVILLFGARGERDLYCRDGLAGLERRWSGRFAFWPVLSETPIDELRSGMVTRHIGEAIAWLGDTTGLQAYLCGPPAMVDAAIDAMAAHGIALDAIFYDRFTDASTTGA